MVNDGLTTIDGIYLTCNLFMVKSIGGHNMVI
jgi:hypothetical protein